MKTTRKINSLITAVLVLTLTFASAVSSISYAADSSNVSGSKDIPAEINSEYVRMNDSSVSTAKDMSNGNIYIYGSRVYKGTPVTFNSSNNELRVYDMKRRLLTENVDYTISYLNNDTIGTATVIATGIGEYCGYISRTFEIYMDKLSKLKTTDIKYNSATISWESLPGADGYRIYSYSLFGFKDVLIKTIDSGSISSCKLSLRPNVDYEIYVVPYRVENGEVVEYEDLKRSSFFETPICYDSKFYSSNAKLSKSIGKVLKTYKDCTKFKGSGECYGYAEWASKKIAKSRKYTKINKKLTAANVKKYICTLKPGAHVRISGHSVVILKASKDVIYWADNNYRCSQGRNRVHYWTGTPEYFARVYHWHAKIEGIYKTISYR